MLLHHKFVVVLPNLLVDIIGNVGLELVVIYIGFY